jgi:hypothetical protein
MLVSIFFLLGTEAAQAVFIPGITGPNFNLTAKTGNIIADDGNSIFMWGYANGTDVTSGPMQYPGPTLIVTQGQTVTVTLYNQVAGTNVSVVFPGQSNVTAAGGVTGVLTNEAVPGGTVTYSFVAAEPGTYTYYSGTRPDLQVEMGLFGALIVRPTLGPSFAYNHAGTAFDHEYLFVLSEIDPVIHVQALTGQTARVDNTQALPVYWFINGRAGFDTIAANFLPIYPNQPYSSLVRAHPGERVLARMIGAGRDPHPFHLHGNHHLVIARDGRLIETTPGSGPDAGEAVFTTTVAPGQTFDALFTWTGEGLGWDAYGHTLGVVNPQNPFQPHEISAQSTLQAAIDPAATSLNLTAAGAFPPLVSFRALIYTSGAANPDVAANREVVILKRTQPGSNVFAVQRGQEGTTPLAWGAGSQVGYTDHGKAIPVVLPDVLDSTGGPVYSGSPYLGASGFLPPGEGGLNPNAGFPYMWHSHSEKELTSNNIFPGGMLTFCIIEHPNVTIP